jgi:hypothetical protein
MPPLGFEPTIPVFERRKTVHALDSAATVIGFFLLVTMRSAKLLINLVIIHFYSPMLVCG